MTESEVQRTLREKIEETPVGEKVTLNFAVIPTIIYVEITFTGGWRITQTIVRGSPFESIRGAGGFLEGIEITIRPYEGLSCYARKVRAFCGLPPAVALGFTGPGDIERWH